MPLEFLRFLQFLTCRDDLRELVPLVDDFGTFEWPKAEILAALHAR